MLRHIKFIFFISLNLLFSLIAFIIYSLPRNEYRMLGDEFKTDSQLPIDDNTGIKTGLVIIFGILYISFNLLFTKCKALPKAQRYYSLIMVFYSLYGCYDFFKNTF